MRTPVVAAWFLFTLPMTLFPSVDAQSEHRERRQALRQELKDAVVVLFAASENERGNLRTGFFQEENFFYLTGWREPEAILMLLGPRETPVDGLADPEEILFLPPRNPERERWTGPKLAPGDAESSEWTGFRTVLPLSRFERQLMAAVEQYPSVYTLSGGPKAERLKQLLPMREIADARPALARMRMTKSSLELDRMATAIDATLAAHREAWRAIKPGVFEYEIAALMGQVYFSRGCERHAYSPIVGSGPNTTVLHYSANRRRIEAGDLVLMDVGGECGGYAADVTRTVPAGGRFTPRQREIYEIVLGAQKAAIAAVKPGASLGKNAPDSLYQVALEYLNAHGQDQHGEPLGKYFTHGIGHHVGLEVHDANDPSAPLAPGMVVTIEPGLYIPEENIGVRIEDMVLVTEDGARVLTGGLPTEPDEIEAALVR